MGFDRRRIFLLDTVSNLIGESDSVSYEIDDFENEVTKDHFTTVKIKFRKELDKEE